MCMEQHGWSDREKQTLYDLTYLFMLKKIEQAGGCQRQGEQGFEGDQKVHAFSDK